VPPSSVATADKRLTDNERRLVDVIADAAARRVKLSRTEVGTLAGYGQGEPARVSATRALARPHVRAALMEAAAGIIAEGAPDAAAMLRHVVQDGARPDAPTVALELLKLSGMGAPEGGAGGMIAVQVVLPGDLGAILTQAAPRTAQVIDVEAESDGDNCRVEAVGGSRKARDPSPRAAKPGRKAKGRGKKRRARSVARAPRTISSASGVVSGHETDGDAG
jgi:hypothetical protein